MAPDLSTLFSSSDKPEHASTLPAACYMDPAVHEAELERIFRRQWLVVARLDEIAEPGDYVSVDLCDEPLVVVRGDDGSVRVLSRICRHRAMPIVQGCGNTKSFSCPYHRWTYGLDGGLRSAPAMEQAVGFDPGTCGLPSLPVEIWQGWIFTCLAGDPAPLTPQLAAMDKLLAPFDLQSMRVCAVLDYPSPWNWKVMVENFMESYHHIGPHVGSLQPTIPAFGTHALDVEGPIAVLENPGKTDEVPPFWACCLFPSHLFAVSRGETPFVAWYQLHMRRHNYFDLQIKLMAPKQTADNPAIVDALRTALHNVHLEDIPVCEGVQRGLRSKLSRPGRLSHLERCNWQFQRYLIAQLGDS